MGLFAWLSGRAPDLHDAPRHLPPLRRALLRPDAPDPAELRLRRGEVVDAVSVEIENVSCVIEYADARGIATSRTITMLRIVPGDAAPILQAVCHLRHAVRHFRLDRIRAIITISDGEVFEAGEFFKQFLGLEILGISEVGPEPAAAKRENPGGGPAADLIRALHDTLRPALTILVTASRCDDHIDPREMELIFAYAENEAVLAHGAGRPGTPLDLAALDRFPALIAAMRPQRDTVAEAARAVLTADPDSLGRFLRTLRRVVEADGRIADEERDLLADLDRIESALLAGNFRQFAERDAELGEIIGRRVSTRHSDLLY